MGFHCARCGEWHDELPFAYHAPAPAYWTPAHEGEEGSWLDEETCVVGEELFFVRGLIRIPVLDAEHDFEWGGWVSLSAENFARTVEIWDREGREAEPPIFGWLAVNLPTYEPSTLSLETDVHTRPVGLRPLIELQPTDHPLAVQQREGITLAHVRSLAEQLLHT